MVKTDRYELHNGDCIEVFGQFPSDSVDYSVFSPPFASLYTYTDDERDMGNCSSKDEFFEHFDYLIPELFRVTKPGRLLSFHCMNLPKSKERDGIIGLSDFRGQLIAAFEKHGWTFHSEVCIWKDPVTAMQRTKAIGLLHKQIKKDSCMSRQGIPDYVVTMRKDGVNQSPVAGAFDRWIGEEGYGPSAGAEGDHFSIEVWQRYASPVWMDIDPSDTLQYTHARTEKDERHICPLQIGVIRRCIELWSNPGDLVASPFAGIGSEGVVALEEGRRFIGAELKDSYYDWAAKNLQATYSARQMSLLDQPSGSQMEAAAR